MFSDHIREDVVHKRLESGWSIAEPEEHDSRFKESERRMNAPFHWSSSRIRILLNPHRTSNLVNLMESFMSSINSEIRGKGYALRMVWEFKYR